MNPGDIVLEVKGNIHSILAAERLVLNFMQRLSGIATLTSKDGIKTERIEDQGTGHP